MNVMSLIYYLVAGVAFAIALSPAIDGRADTSFAWHMAQHLALVFIVAPALVAARPFQAFAALAPKALVAETVRATRWSHVLAHPAVALAFFIATMWVTHFSPLYELALDRAWVHVAEHLLYLAAGVLFWLPVLAPQPLRPLPYPARLLYLFVALPQGALLAFALGGAHRVLYAHYATVKGVSGALADQSNAAAVMWICGGLAVFVAFLVTFGAWAVREEDPDALPRGIRGGQTS